MVEYILVHGISVAKSFEPETFGRLTTIGPQFKLPVGKKGRYHGMQVCLCCCPAATAVVVSSSDMRTGNTLSCGCLQKERTSKAKQTHGKSHSNEYRIWAAMLERCGNPDTKCYKNYGGRGITVCDEWTSEGGFSRFLACVGARPTPKHSLDRIDNNQGYFPGNVRWTDDKTQARNRRNTYRLTHNGETLPVVEWAERLGLPYTTILSRLRIGWSVEKALSTPRQKGKKKCQH